MLESHSQDSDSEFIRIGSPATASQEGRYKSADRTAYVSYQAHTQNDITSQLNLRSFMLEQQQDLVSPSFDESDDSRSANQDKIKLRQQRKLRETLILKKVGLAFDPFVTLGITLLFD